MYHLTRVTCPGHLITYDGIRNSWSSSLRNFSVPSPRDTPPPLGPNIPLTTRLSNTAVFYVTPCSLATAIHISEEPGVSILRADELKLYLCPPPQEERLNDSHPYTTTSNIPVLHILIFSRLIAETGWKSPTRWNKLNFVFHFLPSVCNLNFARLRLHVSA